MSKLPLSIFIICWNEQDRIGLVLDALKDLTDDIVIVDSGSTDSTLDIAKKYTDRIYHKDWQGYGPQKVFGQAQCKYDWILNLDADEILLSDVKTNIRTLMARNESHRKAAYNLRFCQIGISAKSFTPRPFCPVNVTPRLYDRRRAGFKDSAVHDKVVIYNGSDFGDIGGDIAHISYTSYSQLWDKTRSYCELQAEDWVARGKKPGILKLIFDPPLFFIKHYFMRRFCFLGLDGLITSFILSASRALRIGLTLEKLKPKPQTKG